tara:strand:+ start:68 stop:802 length:735 start_codon:yes stop_codon:yes gene_type:complete
MVADIAIFLVIFAIISSAISVYFDSKIDSVEDIIIEENGKDFYFRDWRRTLFTDLLYLEKQEIYHNLFLADHKKILADQKNNKETFNNYYQGEISYDLNYCLNILDLTAEVPYTFQYAIKDLRHIASEEDLASYNIDIIEKENNDYLVLYESDEYPDAKSMCEGEGIEKIYEIHKRNLEYLIIFNKFFHELKKESNNNMISNYNLLNHYYRMSSIYIFVAFLLQLIIFVIIQFFELRASSSKEE